jgi:hypothetical protein
MMTNFRMVSTRLALICGLLFALGNVASAFEAQSTWGGVGGGSANAQTFPLHNVQSLANVIGVPLRYVPAADNTGPATIGIAALTPVAVRRPTNIGLQPLSGGELQAGVTMTVMYNGSTIEIIGPIDMTPIGRTVEFRGSATPRGALIEDGSCVSRTVYAALFAVLSTTYGICDGATTFGVPDSRGAMFAALDTQGGNGAANRITNAGSGCDATAIGLCGSQNRSISTAYLPASGLSIPGLSVPGLSVPGLSIPGLSVPGLSVPSLSIPSLSVSTATANVGHIPLSSGAVSSLQTQGTATTNITPANVSGTWSDTTSLAATGTTVANVTGTGTTGAGTTGAGTTGGGTTGGGTTGGGTTGAMGSGTAFPVLNPISLGRRAIKY